MKLSTRTLLAVSVLVPALLASARVDAQPRGEVTLAWDGCRVTGGGALNKNFACNTDAGQDLLVCAFIPSATANLRSLVAAVCSLDIYSMSPTLPAWWQLASANPVVPGCRPSSNLLI